MPGKLIFITGGARSGKSTFAEELARAHGGRVAFIATATVGDDEMAQRVRRHRERRPLDWSTWEARPPAGAPAEAGLAATLTQAARDHQVILVDCLTVYLAALVPPDLPVDRPVAGAIVQAAQDRLDRELDLLVAALDATEASVIIVSNEVGSGLVPPYPAGRLFRDLAGRANQRLARAADFAYLVVAGTVLDLHALRGTNFPWELTG